MIQSTGIVYILYLRNLDYYLPIFLNVFYKLQLRVRCFWTRIVNAAHLYLQLALNKDAPALQLFLIFYYRG